MTLPKVNRRPRISFHIDALNLKRFQPLSQYVLKCALQTQCFSFHGADMTLARWGFGEQEDKGEWCSMVRFINTWREVARFQ